MSSKKIIAVTTATGEQGTSVVRELLKDGTFAVRGLTRNPSSPKAQELAKQGVEIVKADTGDLASLEKAFEGVYGVYGNTDFWSLFAENQYQQAITRDAETQHGKNLVDAAKKNGVQHFVWSTLDKTPTEVYHFVSKFTVGEYLEKSGIPNWTLLYTSCYFTNFTKPGFAMLKKGDDGSFTIHAGCPTDTKVDWFDPGETGYWTLPIFKDVSKWSGKRVDAAGEAISVRDLATQIKSITGVTVNVPEITKEQFLSDEYRKNFMDELWLNWAIWVKGEVSRDYKQAYDVAISQPSNAERFIKNSPDLWKALEVEYKA